MFSVFPSGLKNKNNCEKILNFVDLFVKGGVDALPNVNDKYETHFGKATKSDIPFEFTKTKSGWLVNNKEYNIQNYLIEDNSTYLAFINHFKCWSGKFKILPVLPKPAVGGAGKAKWSSTGQNITLADGTQKRGWLNSKTGEIRTKKMVMRNGKKVAIYVKTNC